MAFGIGAGKGIWVICIAIWRLEAAAEVIWAEEQGEV